VVCRELDELEREDFTRLKMVKKKKEEAIKLAEFDRLNAAADERAVAAQPVAHSAPVHSSASDADAGQSSAGVAADSTTSADAKPKKRTPKKKGGGGSKDVLHGSDATDDSDIVFK
jgi:hypothetical protein